MINSNKDLYQTDILNIGEAKKDRQDYRPEAGSRERSEMIDKNVELIDTPPPLSNRKTAIKSPKAPRIEQRMKQFEDDKLPAIIISRILDTAFPITGREMMAISDPARKIMFKGAPAL